MGATLYATLSIGGMHIGCYLKQQKARRFVKVAKQNVSVPQRDVSKQFNEETMIHKIAISPGKNILKQTQYMIVTDKEFKEYNNLGSAEKMKKWISKSKQDCSYEHPNSWITFDAYAEKYGKPRFRPGMR
jgi:hypothetical protein